MVFEIIVCVNKNNCIGNDNKLLSYLPSDLKNFKKITNNSIVIMGRKTFDSLPNGALPNRINIVITHDNNFTAPNVYVTHSVEECIELCKVLNSQKCYVIGGGSIYHAFLEKDIINKIIMTCTENDVEGDVYFPTLNKDKWVMQEVKREFFDERDECNYHIFEYIKK